MTISIQLVEVPENEQVLTRQVAFPSMGGTIGRAFDCTLVLPDFSRFLSRVHAEIVPCADGSGGYELINRSANGLTVNVQPLSKGKRIALFDGDVIKLGGYVLLVSDLNSALSKPSPVKASGESNQTPLSQPSTEQPTESPFKHNLVDQDDFMSPFGQEETLVSPSMSTEEQSVGEFSVEHVQSDDPFGDDPFSENDMTLKEPRDTRADMLDDDLNIPVLEAQSLARETSPSLRSREQQMFQENLKLLTKLVEQQKPARRENIGREKLMACLQVTLDRFLETLTPQTLEEEFDDYLSGWGSKDKKYWDLYRKQFNRKLKQGDFRRQFLAMFVEELREKDQQS
ncbi:type VI secretion system-associated FHA domain protein [Litoribrevibacter euphylliae]|uniref:Type VI secretion system-associated FHA domain protein n=1 Tax=Litoribrevibacter euphylliae TaxID=1834034 RepID=A0ABV7HJ79_9GAMM